MKRQWYGVQPDEQACRRLPSHPVNDAKEAETGLQPPVDDGSKPAIGPRRTSLMAEAHQVTRDVAQKVAAAFGVPLRVLWAEPGEDSGNG